MSQISQEIRSQIAQLDEQAGLIKEYLEDLDHNDEAIDNFEEALTEIMDQITSLQENMGWI